MQLLFWYIGVVLAALLYVRTIRLTARMRHTQSHGRMIAIAAWARMLMAGGVLLMALFWLPLFHFILITVVFIAVVWARIWFVTTKG